MDITLYRDSNLNINVIQMRQAIDTALREATDEQNILSYIDRNDGIQLLTDYYFINENDDSFEYFTIMDIFFDREGDFEEALDDLDKMDTIDTTSFVEIFEEKLRDQIWIITAPPSSLFINGVTINSMKITKMDIDDNTGSALLIFDNQQATTTTTNPTSSPSTPIPTMDDDGIQDTVIIYKDSGSDSVYSFDTEAPYWILLIFFLFLGCCCGCAFWYIVCVKYHDRVRSKMMTKLQMVQTRSNNTPKSNKDDKKRGKKKPKTREYHDGITSEGNEREESYIDEEAEERRKKKERYIEHGSDDDSEKAERVFNQPFKKKKQRKKKQRNDKEEESEDSIERIVNRKMSHRKTYEYSSSSSDGGRKKMPKKRNKNKRTGVVEPIRYDEDGKRKLTTKELMAQYKQQRMKGGDSIDLSYKVGGIHSPRNKKKMKFDDDGSDNDEAKELEGDTRGDSEYEFEINQEQSESSMSGINHPHYKPEPKKPSERRPKLNKIKEKEKKNKNMRNNKKRGRDRASSSTKRTRSKDRTGSKRKSNNNDNNRNVRHNRSGTADFGGGRNKYGARRVKSDSGGLKRNNNKQRPVSARFDNGGSNTPGSYKGRTKGGDDGGRYSKPMKRPQSAKPGMKIKIDGRNNRRTKRHFDDEEDSDEDDESYSAEPVNNNNRRRNNDYDDEDTDSEYYD